MSLLLGRREALRHIGLGAAGLLAGCSTPGGGLRTSGGRWYRGNLHMHTYWSDGRALPEVAAGLYKRLGYDFISLTDHNIFADDPQCWKRVEEKEGKWPPCVTQPFFDAYLREHASEAHTRQQAGMTEVRLKTFAELQQRFEEPGRFLMLPGVELTQTLAGTQVHMNVLNLPDVIPFVKGGPLNKSVTDGPSTVSELIRHDATQVSSLAAKLRRSSMLTLNHPQWVYWDILPQNLIDNPEVRFFEVCNGGSAFAPHPGAPGLNNDSFWDAVNAFRSLKGHPLLLGLGTDDTHYYTDRKAEQRVADAWVMVRSGALAPDALLAAMQAGDFYATCGVLLDEVDFSPAARTLRVKVRAAQGARYRIRFIATKRGFDPTVRSAACAAEKGHGARTLPVYSPDIGRTVALTEGVEATYRMASDDLYVRARVESDAPCGYMRHFHPETQVAWTQPFGAA